MTIPFSRGSKLTLSALISLSGLASASTGCITSADDMVNSRLNVIGQSQNALNAATITSITGTYDATCDGRSPAGTDPWTASISGGPAADELRVRTNDSNCTLVFDNVVTPDGAFIGAPPIPLNSVDTYQASASAYALSAGPLSFYGNAKINLLTFAANFTITLLVSDTPFVTDAGTKGATFATVTSTVAASTVAAPNYTISFTPFNVEADVNAVVQTVSGFAQLTAGSVVGQDYGLYQGALTGVSTLTEVETAYASSTQGLLSSLTTLQLPAALFTIVAVDLDTAPQRTVIIRNTDQDVTSYQLLLITFIP